MTVLVAMCLLCSVSSLVSVLGVQPDAMTAGCTLLQCVLSMSNMALMDYLAVLLPLRLLSMRMLYPVHCVMVVLALFLLNAVPMCLSTFPVAAKVMLQLVLVNSSVTVEVVRAPLVLMFLRTQSLVFLPLVNEVTHLVNLGWLVLVV